MPLWQPTEEDSELIYILAAALCWTSGLWYGMVYEQIVAPLHNYAWLRQLMV